MEVVWPGDHERFAYQRLGREAEAAEVYRHAAKLEPGAAVFRKTLAEGFAALAYRKQSVGQVEAAVGLAPDNGRFRAALKGLKEPPRQ